MKKVILLILAIAVSFSMGFFLKSALIKQSDSKAKAEQPNPPAKVKTVTGIGGIFFKCKDPAKIKQWYKTHLGLDTDEYGARWEWQEGTDSTKKGSIQWSPFAENDNYFKPSTREFMINYRVENLANIVEQLKKENVVIVDTIETYDYGKFIHIMDIEGNKIELWEPSSN